MNKSILRPWLELARVSNLPTVWSNILAAWLLAGGKWDWKPLAWLLVGGSLIYTGGMFLNDAADVKFDREHRQERPIPSGRISAAQAWTAGVGFLVSGFAMFVWGAEACIWLTGALVTAIVAYDLYHKPWAGSVFIMGSCRTLLYLAAASAVTGTLDWFGNGRLIAKAVALGGFIVAVSLAARRESNPAAAKSRLRFLIYLGFAMPILMALDDGPPARIPCPPPDWPVWLWSGLVAGLIIISNRIMRRPPPANIGRGVGMLLAGICWVDALALSNRFPEITPYFGCAFPLLLLWQRKIAAT